MFAKQNATSHLLITVPLHFAWVFEHVRFAEAAVDFEPYDNGNLPLHSRQKVDVFQ